MSRMRKAIEEYQMIQDGDRIAVGVSGGKDSLVTLMALKELQRFLPVKYDLIALTIDLGFEDFHVDELIRFFENRDRARRF
jgi:tRNA 2-thiocytidine biosynthesis protein TtcA